MMRAEKDGVYGTLVIEYSAKVGPGFDPRKALAELCQQLQEVQNTFNSALQLTLREPPQ